MPSLGRIFVGVCFLVSLSDALLRAQPGEVKHSSGRPLPGLPPIKAPVMFNTPEAA
jgi:hypothetical protein